MVSQARNFIALIAVATLVSGCSREQRSHAQLGDSDAPAGRTKQADPLIAALEADGYSVQLGRVAPFFLEDCAALPSCFGSNASSPYLLWQLGEASVWRLREDEAVVLVGPTPPRAAYFSYTPYVFSRFDPASGAPATVYASLSDALNLANIHTGSEQVFEQPVAIVVTADAITHAAVRSALIHAAVLEAAINTLPLPANGEVRLGLEQDRDSLQVLGRVALFEDAARGRAYLERPPLTLLRVTPKQPHLAQPLKRPPRVARGSGRNEQHLLPALDALEAAIRDKHRDQQLEPVMIYAATVLSTMVDPQRCLKNLTNCKGEVSDTTYAGGPRAERDGGPVTRLSEVPTDFYVVYGVNHEAAGKATYSNVVVQNQNKQAGVAAFTSRDMAGSARRYLPDHPDSATLFALKIARACNAEPYCIEVPVQFPGVPLDESLTFVFRAYLEPGRTVSSAPEELLTERVLHVSM